MPTTHRKTYRKELLYTHQAGLSNSCSLTISPSPPPPTPISPLHRHPGPSAGISSCIDHNTHMDPPNVGAVGGPWLQVTSFAVSATLSGLQTHGVGTLWNVASAVWAIVCTCKENKYQLYSLVSTATEYLDQIKHRLPPSADDVELKRVLSALQEELESVHMFLKAYKEKNVSSKGGSRAERPRGPLDLRTEPRQPAVLSLSEQSHALQLADEWYFSYKSNRAW